MGGEWEVTGVECELWEESGRLRVESGSCGWRV